MKQDLFEGYSSMKFNGAKVAFGRHETFSLRYSWLSKGFQAFTENPQVFETDDATVALGVGKNMVSSIRFWLRASRMIHLTKNEPTALGRMILDEKKGFDPYLEDEATIWLIHWLLATNSELATSIFWFFNKFHKPEFTSQELTTALSDFTKEQVLDKKRPSAGTIKNDAQLIHRMYTQSKGNTRMPIEEALDSPLALLRLVSQSAGGRSFQSKADARQNLPLGVLGFAISQLFLERKVTAIPIEELMFAREEYPSPGSIFRLTENALITKIEQLIHYMPSIFEIRETAGIHQLYMLKNDIEPFVFLEKHYKEVLKGIAA
jgi:hypothetical protein